MSPESKLLVLRERMKGMRDISADIKRKEQEYLSLTRIKVLLQLSSGAMIALLRFLERASISDTPLGMMDPLLADHRAIFDLDYLE